VEPQYEGMQERDPVLPSVYDDINKPSDYENATTYQNVP
jgi:hypothetical protein